MEGIDEVASSMATVKRGWVLVVSDMQISLWFAEHNVVVATAAQAVQPGLHGSCHCLFNHVARVWLASVFAAHALR
jgi:hypothetical protein